MDGVTGGGSVQAEAVAQEHRQANAADPRQDRRSNLAHDGQGDKEDNEWQDEGAEQDGISITFHPKDGDDGRCTLRGPGFQRTYDGHGEEKT